LLLVIKQRYGIPEGLEIKCKDIVEGRKDWRKIGPRKRVEFLNFLINELSIYSTSCGYSKFIIVIVKCRGNLTLNEEEIF